MMLRDAKIMVLGGWGLVGTAVCRNLLSRGPSKLVLLSLKEAEAKSAYRELSAEFPHVTIVPEWGDIFVRSEFKDLPRYEIMKRPDLRRKFTEDVFEQLTS